MLANHMERDAFRAPFLEAYVRDTLFTNQDVRRRELETPVAMLRMDRPEEETALLSGRKPLGRVVVFVPKNSLALTLVKAIAGSFLMGNETWVYFPRQLARTLPIYADLLERQLPGTRVVRNAPSSASFLRQCLKDPTVEAVVIYGDDAWIDTYRPMARTYGKKIIFEGPGNDPMIVLPDAQLQKAVDAAVRAGLNNGGQSCSALERFFVHQSVAPAFVELLAERLRSLRAGPAHHPDTDIGPIQSPVVRQRLEQQLQAAVRAGAKIVCGGTFRQEKESGLPICQPAVLSGCTSTMDIVSQENFGPVFPILTFHDTRTLMPALDATRYGLNAAVFGGYDPALDAYLRQHHRNWYWNATGVCPETLASRFVDGGFRRSGFIWEPAAGDYQVRTGRRWLTVELSHPDAAG
jgi:succinate-semialdehyde dehydrogenase/glutarate-semialdehyde dehydrogenase